jgi:hypothetical protein
MGNLSCFCVYTMLHSDKLDTQAKTSSAHVLTENKVWITGHLL